MGAFGIFWCLRRRKQGRRIEKVDKKSNQEDGPEEMKEQQFTFSEIKTITNNFERVIGRGDFGSVYHGHLDQSTQVAVKMLSLCFADQHKLQNQGWFLTRVRHRNLNSVVGYCCQGTDVGLIHDYVANGNLRDHLLDATTNPINWEKRLQIAIDSAQGLEYLHNGCNPPIIHGNVKPANILLDGEFHAKLSDFGLSIVFPYEGGSHESTRVVGTPGYIDPMYYISNWLDEKSDVFSFGVVLLEIITGRLAMGRDREKKHIVSWVRPLVVEGEISSIVCPSLRGEYDTNSVWKAVELAMACTTIQPNERPTMGNILCELKECMALEEARSGQGQGQGHDDSESIDSSEVNPPNVEPALNNVVAADV